ncbi:Monocarboxylate transporter 12 [Nymphon striatum]|nr:Monocarboxylate transporter 12 [Nymphon striatum]
MIHNEAKSDQRGSQDTVSIQSSSDKAVIQLPSPDRRGTLILRGSILDDVPECSDEDDTGSSNCEVDIPTPPDGGWGWVIVAASFISNVIVDGISYSFGVFLPEFVSYFGSSKAKAAWIGSLLSGCYLSVGPLVSAATNRYGCRPVAIAGSILSAFAFGISTQVQSIEALMLTFGIIGGVGLGFIYLPAIVSVGYYFERRRAFATGIAVCGSGVGTFIMAPICQKLLEVYSWQGALLIIAGISLNGMVFGALMRPLESQTTEKNKPLLQRMAEEKKERLRRGSMPVSQYQVVQHSDGTLEKRPKTLMNTEPGVHSTFNLDELDGIPTPDNAHPRMLSPIKEIRPSSLPNKTIPIIKTPPEECPPETEMKKSDSVTEGKPADSVCPTEVSQGSGSVPNVADTNYTALKRRSSLKVPVVGIKPSLSNITVNSDLRKHSLTVRLSASGYLMPGSRNNNYSIEEVWDKTGQESRVRSPMGHRNSIALKPDKKEFSRPMYRKDIFYSGSIMNLPEYQSQKDLKSYLSSITSIPKETYYISEQQVDGITVLEKKTMCPCLPDLPKSMKDILSAMLNVNLMHDRSFMLLCFSNVLAMLGFYIPFFFIVDQAVIKGISPEKAALLLSVIGISNTIGRVITGWVSDIPRVDALTVNNITLCLGGITTLLVPLCPDYPSMCFLCVCYGTFMAPYIALTSIVVVDLLGLDQLTNAFGLLTLFRGVAVIVGTPIAGKYYNLLQFVSYPISDCSKSPRRRGDYEHTQIYKNIGEAFNLSKPYCHKLEIFKYSKF